MLQDPVLFLSSIAPYQDMRFFQPSDQDLWYPLRRLQQPLQQGSNFLAICCMRR